MSALELHVEEYGAGEPAIVLLHGFAGSARNLRPQARFLAARHHVVLFDARGHARSPAPEDGHEYEPEEFVDDVRRVLERTRARSVVLGGISMGAAIALRYALAHQKSLRALVLSSFPPAGNASSPPWALSFADEIDRRGLETAGEHFVWGGPRYDEAAVKWIRQGFLEHRPHALSAVLRQVIATHPAVTVLEPELATLRLPTLVIAGERDTPSLGPSKDLARCIPGARLVVIPGAGHVVNLEKPQSFNEALRGFLSQIET